MWLLFTDVPILFQITKQFTGYACLFVCCPHHVMCTVYIQDTLQSCTMYVTKAFSSTIRMRAVIASG